MCGQLQLQPGAPVRVTIRSGELVRLEGISRPDEEQQKRHITQPWYRDIAPGPRDPNWWLKLAADNTDFSAVPDGEWAGEAIGPSISRNPLNLEEHQVTLSSLFPWRNSLPGAPIPPELGRVPLDFEDLAYWLPTQRSSFTEETVAPLEGIVWWWHETPVAMVRTRDFRR